MAELLDRWFEWRQGVRPISLRTVDNYRRDMDWFILPALGKLPVARLDAATLDRFYARLRKQGGKNGRPLAPSSVREVHAILSGTHERGTSHYELLRAFLEDSTLERATAELDARGYRTHEFGDSVLIL